MGEKPCYWGNQRICRPSTRTAEITRKNTPGHNMEPARGAETCGPIVSARCQILLQHRNQVENIFLSGQAGHLA